MDQSLHQSTSLSAAASRPLLSSSGCPPSSSWGLDHSSSSFTSSSTHSTGEKILVFLLYWLKFFTYSYISQLKFYLKLYEAAYCLAIYSVTAASLTYPCYHTLPFFTGCFFTYSNLPCTKPFCLYQVFPESITLLSSTSEI